MDSEPFAAAPLFLPALLVRCRRLEAAVGLEGIDEAVENGERSLGDGRGGSGFVLSSLLLLSLCAPSPRWKRSTAEAEAEEARDPAAIGGALGAMCQQQTGDAFGEAEKEKKHEALRSRPSTTRT